MGSAPRLDSRHPERPDKRTGSHRRRANRRPGHYLSLVGALRLPAPCHPTRDRNSQQNDPTPRESLLPGRNQGGLRRRRGGRRCRKAGNWRVHWPLVRGTVLKDRWLTRRYTILLLLILLEKTPPDPERLFLLQAFLTESDKHLKTKGHRSPGGPLFPQSRRFLGAHRG